MTFLYRTLAIVAVALRRLISQRGLAIATALGLVASAAIVMSIPLYTDAVYYRVLQQELERPTVEGEMQRPPFAFMYRYVGSLYGLKQWEDIEQVDTYLTQQAPEVLNLPQQINPVRYVRTDNFRLFPSAETQYADVRDPMAWVNFAFASDFQDRITILEGNFPAVAESDPSASMEILISRTFAEQFGIQVGEEYVSFRRTEGDGVSRNVQVPVRVSGVWEAINPADPYWFYRQSVFDNQFFISEDSFRLRLVPLLTDEIAQALWYIVKDGSQVNSSDVGWLISRISTISQQAASLLPDTRLEVSPQESLVNYRRQSNVLNVLLYAFSIPIIGLLLAFIGLVVSLSVNRQRNEIAVLRSRGATIAQVMGIAALEAFLLGSVALAAGMPVSQQIAHVIGATRSFLNFTFESDL
ncbi:MAG: FtsX-like permease family protein, partial [Litorilinea sp.]